MTNREDLEVHRGAYMSFRAIGRRSGLALPQNKTVPGSPNDDLLLRYLDCAVIRHLHGMIEAQPTKEPHPYDTVRGLFTEGGPLFPGSGIRSRTHTQIAVRNPECIVGVFLPKPYPESPEEEAETL